jgi:quinol monooxygenase YgiN
MNLKKVNKIFHKEEGCIRYDLHQDNEKPEVFIFFENWESQELWQIYMKSSHLKSFIEITDGSLVDLTVNQISKIG